MDALNKNARRDSALSGLLGNGKSLKEHRDEVLARTKETGFYNGLRKLELKDSDPIQYEKMFSRLRGGLVHARETAKKIAASPIVEQEGELCFTLYNAAGDCVLTSTGIIIHVGTMGAAIKYMIENDWESNPGIDPGDMFTNNDCSIGNVHPCDISTIVPIFWTGQAGGLGRWRHPRHRSRRDDAGLDVDGPGVAVRRRPAGHLPQDRASTTCRCATGCTRASATCAPPSTGSSTSAPASPAAT